jgi:type II secretory pathway pseudopilin PulG
VNRTRRQAGVTLTDVIVGLVMLAILSAVAIPALGYRAREQANRAKCANNLRQIALACMMYASNEVRTGAFPRTYFDESGVPPTEYTGANSPYSFDVQGGPKSSVAANDVSASLYLVLKTQDITPPVFTCPSGDATPWVFPAGDAVDKHSNFPGRQHVDYSYACPFPSQAALGNAGKKWVFNNSLGSDYPLAADMNPGGAALLTTPIGAGRQQMAAVNSPNHDRDGQNVVYCDAHVEFQQTPFCGVPRQAYTARDNIYTTGAAGGGAPGGVQVKDLPLDAEDMVLLPTIADGFQPPARARGALGGINPLVWAGVLGLLLLVGLIVLVSVVLRKQPVPVAQMAPPGMMPPGYPPQGYVPPGYPPPGYPPQGVPPPPPPPPGGGTAGR